LAATRCSMPRVADTARITAFSTDRREADVGGKCLSSDMTQAGGLVDAVIQ
jgi:hypothetical protein